MDEFLKYIAQFGVIPILLYIGYELNKRNKELVNKLTEKNEQLHHTINEKNDEIRTIEKENVALLYKSYALIKKVTDVVENLDNGKQA